MREIMRFAVLGDSRGEEKQINETVLGQLLKDIKTNHNPDFILFGGDMILGHQTKGVDPNTTFIREKLLEWRTFVENTLGVASLQNYVYPVIGNHDYSNENDFQQSICAFNEVFNYLPSDADGNDMLSGYGKTVYAFDYGPCKFIMLNTVFRNVGRDQGENRQVLLGITKKQMQWLENILKYSKKQYHFIMFHCPIIGTNVTYDSLPAKQQEALFKLFNKYPITGVYVGHEHQYNRRAITNVFFPGQFELSAQINQITSGAAGAPFEAPGNSLLNIVVGPLLVYEYGIVKVYADHISARFYDINGTTIDQFKQFS